MTTFALVPLESTAPLLPDPVSAAVERVAARFVRTWGFTTVTMVGPRVILPWRSDLPRAVLVRDALADLADLEWLDPTREWFTLTARASHVRASIEKIYAVAGAVSQPELVAALSKRRSFANAPSPVVQAFVAAMSSRVRRARRPAAPRLTREEAILVALLRASGGQADIQSLVRRAEERGTPASLTTRVLKSSPLILHSWRGTYRLVGAPAGKRPLISSPRWEAALRS